MVERSQLLQLLGGEPGCRELSTQFYKRVAKDPVLRPLFPGKTLRCATEEFAAFLIQFLGGDEEQTQHRWWLSLRESHARFRISPAQRSAWLRNMRVTLDAAPIDQQTRSALCQFFDRSSAYVTRVEDGEIHHGELAERWREQRILDRTIEAIATGRDDEALALAAGFESRSSVFVGLLARMLRTGRPGLVRFAVEAVNRAPSLARARYSGRTLLHFASAAGCLEVVEKLLAAGVDPNVQDGGGHSPLYSVANECAFATGPEVVRALVRAGADVNANGGVTRLTALHTAARRGHLEIARTLLDCGAAIRARDGKGDTPLERARNCRKGSVAQLLIERGALTP
jgi:hemoglobin